MKLIFCKKCHDVRKIHTIKVSCVCGKSWGRYFPDGLHAEDGGEAGPLAFVNSSFAGAIGDQPTTDDNGGVPFGAFVVPKECETYKKVEND